MADHDNMLKAKALIQEKRYEDARAILIVTDHPKAQAWLDKLNSIPAAAVGSAPDYTSKLIVVVVLYFVLFVPGLIANHLWANQARKDLQRYGNVPGANGMIGLYKFVMGSLIIFVIGLVAIAILMRLIYG